MEPRSIFIANCVICPEKEVFDLDSVVYKDARHANDYLNEDYEKHFKYPLFAFIFHPRNKVLLLSMLFRSKSHLIRRHFYFIRDTLEVPVTTFSNGVTTSSCAFSD